MKVRQVTIYENVKVTRIVTVEVPENWDVNKIKDAYLNCYTKLDVVENELALESEESEGIVNIEFKEPYDKESTTNDKCTDCLFNVRDCPGRTWCSKED